jgi:hypothetical protein
VSPGLHLMLYVCAANYLARHGGWSNAAVVGLLSVAVIVAVIVKRPASKAKA